MKKMVIFFMIGLLAGMNREQMIIQIKEHPTIFSIIAVFLLIHMLVDLITVVMGVIKKIRKTKFTKDMMQKFREAKMKTMEEI